MAQMQGFPTHGVFLNPDRQPKGSTRPVFCVEREYGIRIGAWAREIIVLAHNRKNLLAVSGRSLLSLFPARCGKTRINAIRLPQPWLPLALPTTAPLAAGPSAFCTHPSGQVALQVRGCGLPLASPVPTPDLCCVVVCVASLCSCDAGSPPDPPGF